MTLARDNGGFAQFGGGHAAADLVADALGDLETIGFRPEAQHLWAKSGVRTDDGIVHLKSSCVDAFLSPLRTCGPEYERQVRMPA